MAKIKLVTLTCCRCGHEWIPTQPVVNTCVNCKSIYWEKPREKGEKARPAKRVKVVTLRCVKCLYSWTPRTEEVDKCPNCKTEYWQKPKVRKVKAAER
jgi:predicted Zn-ribbon and HTH transcriptional regulator